jgi:hypothetical protein
MNLWYLSSVVGEINYNLLDLKSYEVEVVAASIFMNLDNAGWPDAGEDEKAAAAHLAWERDA